MPRNYNLARRAEPTIRELLKTWGTSWAEMRKSARLLAARDKALRDLAAAEQAIAEMEAAFAKRQQEPPQ